MYVQSVVVFWVSLIDRIAHEQHKIPVILRLSLNMSLVLEQMCTFKISLIAELPVRQDNDVI